MRKVLKAIGLVLALALAGFGGSWLWAMPKGDLKGTWATEGYGLVIDVGSLWIDVYERTQISCRQKSLIPSHLSIVKWLEDVSFTNEAGRLRLEVGGILNPIMADRIEALPEICAMQTPDAPGSAQENFDVVWQTMQEHYAFFDLHGVNWEAKRAALRPAADAELDGDALFALIKELLTGLDDGHTYISTGSAGFSPSISEPWQDDRDAFAAVTLGVAPAGVTGLEGTDLGYGWLTPNIGYINFAGMSVQSSAGKPDGEVAAAAFAVIAQRLSEAKALVLDIRFNPGGSDDVALAYAGFFAEGALPVFTKSTRSAAGYTAPYTAMTPDTPMTIDQPVILLTSSFSASASEIFTMAMGRLDHVQSMGTATSGGLSDIMEVSLPNGWLLGFSHQRYLTLEGVSYEGIGVPADLPREMDVDGFRAGTDSLLEEAITRLTAQIAGESN